MRCRPASIAGYRVTQPFIRVGNTAGPVSLGNPVEKPSYFIKARGPCRVPAQHFLASFAAHVMLLLERDRHR